MKDVLSILKQSEREFAVDQIRVDGRPFWPLFRSILYGRLLKDLLLSYPKKFTDGLNKLRNAMFGCTKWLRTYDYVFLSNEMERKRWGDHFIDKLVEGTIAAVGYRGSLYVEQVRARHLKRREYGSKNVASNDLILLIALAYKILVRPGRKARVEGAAVWSDIVKTFDVGQTYEDELSTFLSKVFAFRLVFRWLRPKVVFTTDYGQLAPAFAAKELGITVVEFQHGLIGKVHPYYHPELKLDSMFCPDYILTFGLNDVEALSHGNYVKREHILPIGNFYLSKLMGLPRNPAVVRLIDGYRVAVAVPTDHTNHEYLVDFVSKAALDFPDHLFLILPRVATLVDNSRVLAGNVKLVLEFSFQEVARHCDFNTSTNSTCCLEAPALGARNILVDEDGLASQYFGALLTDPQITRFTRSVKEYQDALINMGSIQRDVVKAQASRNYMSDYDRCLDEALDTILPGRDKAIGIQKK